MFIPWVKSYSCITFATGSIDNELMVCGVGARSNHEGIENAGQLLKENPGMRILPVEFSPKYLHLDLLFVRVAKQLCLAHIQALSPSFLAILKQKKIEIVDVPEEEVLELKCNVVAVNDKTIMSFKTNINTNRKLEALGFTVLKPDLSIFTKGGGGPRCLSFALQRDKVAE
jgi:arginine deiminase